MTDTAKMPEPATCKTHGHLMGRNGCVMCGDIPIRVWYQIEDVDKSWNRQPVVYTRSDHAEELAKALKAARQFIPEARGLAERVRTQVDEALSRYRKDKP